jgi:hypothetical protein
MFVNRHKRGQNRDRLVTQIVSLVHVRMAARSSLLDIRAQLSVVTGREAVPDAQKRVHFISCVSMQDPKATVRLLVGNVYMPQAVVLNAQFVVQPLISDTVARWEVAADYVIVGGNINASTMPR